MPTFSTPCKVTQRTDGWYTDSRNGIVKPYNVSSSALTLGTASKVMTLDKDWKIKLARRKDASNPYDNIKILAYPSRLFCDSVTVSSNPPYRITSRNVINSVSDAYGKVFTGDDETLRDQALTRLKRKLSSHVGDKNLLTPAIELRETRDLIRGLAGLTTSLVDTLLTIRKTKGKSAIKYAQDAWLTYGFGVAPTLSDIQAGLESIGNWMIRDDHSTRLSGTASKVWYTRLSNGPFTGAYGSKYCYSGSLKHELSYRYVSGYDFKVRSSNDYTLAEHLGFGLGSVLPTLWELTPYSWVVDYFANVGAYLDDTFTSYPGKLQYLVLIRRYSMSTDLNYSFSADPNTAFVKNYVIGQSCKPDAFEYFRITRTPLTAIPHRIIRLKTTDEIGQHAVNKLLNLTSLLKPKGR